MEPISLNILSEETAISTKGLSIHQVQLPLSDTCHLILNIAEEMARLSFDYVFFITL